MLVCGCGQSTEHRETITEKIYQEKKKEEEDSLDRLTEDQIWTKIQI